MREWVDESGGGGNGGGGEGRERGEKGENCTSGGHERRPHRPRIETTWGLKQKCNIELHFFFLSTGSKYGKGRLVVRG